MSYILNNRDNKRISFSIELRPFGPDYPNGTYAYFVTLDSIYTPAYPFVVGPQFYGSPINANMGLGGGKFNIT